jgi:hypothetical protein
MIESGKFGLVLNRALTVTRFKIWRYPALVFLVILFCVESVMRESVVWPFKVSLALTGATIVESLLRVLAIVRNLISLLAITGLCAAIVGNWRRGVALCAAGLLLLATICAAKLHILNLPFQLQDLRFTKQIDEYSPIALWPFGATGTIFEVAALMGIFMLAKRLGVGRMSWKKRGICLAASVFMLWGIHYTGFRRWNPTDAYLNEGFTDSLVRSAQFMSSIPIPGGYEQAEVERIAEFVNQRYSTEPAGGPVGQKPYYIVYLLGESFCDPRVVFQGVSFENEPIPRFRENSKIGHSFTMVTPVFGGGTCQTEFETLTGMFTRYIPGQYVFTEYLNRDIDGLPRELARQGYGDGLVQMIEPNMWNYSVNYPHLGFKNITLKDRYLADHPDALVEKQNADELMASEMIRQLKEARSPMFLYGMSTGSHIPYNDSDFSDSPQDARFTVFNSATTPPPEKLKNYLKSIRHLDMAMGRVVDFLNESGKPYVFVFVGDHLPGICVNDRTDTVECLKKSYTVQGFYRSNCESPQFAGEMGYISAPFLMVQVLERHGIDFEGPAFRQAMVYSRRYPVIDGTFWLDSAGRDYSLDKGSELNNRDFWMLEYDLLLGEGYAGKRELRATP